MEIDNIFDSSYVNSTDKTSPAKKQSEVKNLLKETTKEEDMTIYGSSKPKRMIIKATITHG